MATTIMTLISFPQEATDERHGSHDLGRFEGRILAIKLGSFITSMRTTPCNSQVQRGAILQQQSLDDVGTIGLGK